ncbi:hypothetical protein FHS61_002681 [Altererythrobacter atlanticus]|uniref:Uncharacterized protein n=1 Tax=Croceibacterium atlanticum TaxID=1267766 RepID=A0A0F7KXI2_9SPHN|nr:hypothetical protein [Croceibacterium atlanticum]AKH43912.1 hypothetical protein WYH_02885 [Croceibacterium atlanticum]MBB5733638.1 hypothetical protein [Croceibacterium atlanticum]
MITTTRRAALIGALAVPTVAGLAQWRWRHGEDSVLLHDSSLAAGRRFADAGRMRGGEVLALEGDRIRLAGKVLERRPSLIAGVSRHADALMLEDVARESGYVRVAEIHGRARSCSAQSCLPGWQGIARMARMAGGDWVEALADYAAKPGESAGRALASVAAPRVDPGLVIGWVLAPRG